MPEGRIVGGYIVPGLPHLVLPRNSSSRAELRNAFRAAAQSARAARPDVLVIFSTQWISVLGHLIQTRPNPKGVHVDENWYDLGDLSYDFRTDIELANRTIELGTAAGLQVRPVDYDGFPVDTGMLVTLDFFDLKHELPVVGISCNIYSGRDEELKLGKAVGGAVRALGRRAAVIACTGLSGHWFTKDIRDSEDHIVGDVDDAENRRMLDLIAQGKCGAAMDAAPDYARKTGADMQFKAFYWLLGALGSESVKGKVLAYGPIWGSGAAVVEFAV